MDGGTAERPTWGCVLHPPPTDGHDWVPADRGYTTCAGCLDRIRDRLTQIGDRYRRLDPTPTPGGDHGGRAAPGFDSRSPASEHVIAMRDPRSSPVARTWLGADGRLHREAERPPLSVWGVLDTIAWGIADDRGITGPDHRPDVAGLLRWIDHQLDWVTRHHLVVDVDNQLRRLLAQLKPVTGDARRAIGACPNTVDDGDTTRVCAARLYAPLTGDTIRCHACGRAWQRTEWEHLGRLIQDQHVEHRQAS